MCLKPRLTTIPCHHMCEYCQKHLGFIVHFNFWLLYLETFTVVICFLGLHPWFKKLGYELCYGKGHCAANPGPFVLIGPCLYVLTEL